MRSDHLLTHRAQVAAGGDRSSGTPATHVETIQLRRRPTRPPAARSPRSETGTPLLRRPSEIGHCPVGRPRQRQAYDWFNTELPNLQNRARGPPRTATPTPLPPSPPTRCFSVRCLENWRAAGMGARVDRTCSGSRSSQTREPVPERLASTDGRSRKRSMYADAAWGSYAAAAATRPPRASTPGYTSRSQPETRAVSAAPTLTH